MNDWCFRDIYRGCLWDDDLLVCALQNRTGGAVTIYTGDLTVTESFNAPKFSPAQA